MAIDGINPNQPAQPGKNTPRVTDDKIKTDVKGTGDDPEIAAGAQGATQAVSAKNAEYYSFLEKNFGEKLGGEISKALEAKSKQGIELNFKVVKETALESAKKTGETVPAKALNALNEAVLMEGLKDALTTTYGPEVTDKVMAEINSELQKEGVTLNRKIIENIVTHVLTEGDETKKVDEKKFKEFSGKLDVVEKELMEEMKKKILPMYQEDVSIFKDAQSLWSFNNLRTQLIRRTNSFITDSKDRIAEIESTERRLTNETLEKMSVEKRRKNIPPQDKV